MITPLCYAARSTSKDILWNSSSGGIFSAASDFVLESDGLVVCSVYSYENQRLEFMMLHNKKERDQARGSKYFQSYAGDIFLKAKTWLSVNEDKILLFVGLGCQADSFKNYMESIGLSDRVMVMDLICHGVGSPKVWKDYEVYLSSFYGNKINFLTFKDKRDGWLHPYAYVKIGSLDRELSEYVNTYYSKCCLRPSCHSCPYTKIDRNTDITIGDYWGVNKYYPDFYDEMGTSIILIHSTKGKMLFESISDSLNYIEIPVDKAMQDNLKSPTTASESRDRFWSEYARKRVRYIMDLYGPKNILQKVSLKLTKILRGGGI